MSNVNLDNIPDFLKDNGRFCVWRYLERDGKKTKPPYNPNNPSQLADVKNHATFAPLSVCTPLLESGNFDGLGIRIDGGLVGIDIDGCITDGELNDMARDVMETVKTYTEISPSGNGLRLFALCRCYRFDKKLYYSKNNGLEIYTSGDHRYLTVTGNRLNDLDVMEGREEQINEILTRYMKRPTEKQVTSPPVFISPLSLSDADLIERARQATNGMKFASLYDNSGWGSYSEFQKQGGEPDHSRADLGLCTMLAYWTQKDYNRIDSIFRTSGLMRSKWDKKIGTTTYGAMTIDKAISACTTVYNPDYKQVATAKTATPAPAPAGSQVTAPTPTEQPTAPAPIEQLKPPAPPSFGEYIKNDFQKDIARTKEPISTGFDALDEYLDGGLMPGLHVVAAMPGAGKTSICWQMACQIAQKGHDALFFSLEQSKRELASKAIGRTAALTISKTQRGIKYKKSDKHAVMAKNIMRGERNKTSIEAEEKFITSIGDHLTVYDDEDVKNIDQIKMKINDYMDTGRRPVVFVDYLQKINPPKFMEGKGTKEKIDYISEELSSIAKSRKITLVAICATNRASYYVPFSMEALKESGDIDFDSWVVMGVQYAVVSENKIFKEEGKNLVQRREIIKQEKKRYPRKMELFCDKNKNGESPFACRFDYYPEKDLFIETSKPGEDEETTDKIDTPWGEATVL